MIYVVIILGASVRVLTIINPTAWWALPVVSLGQILNAIVGPLVMASPSKFSGINNNNNQKKKKEGVEENIYIDR